MNWTLMFFALGFINLLISIFWQIRDKYDRAIYSLLWAMLMIAKAKGVL